MNKIVTATLVFATALSLSAIGQALGSDDKPILSVLRSTTQMQELPLPPLPLVNTMPWLSGWQNADRSCMPARNWHQDYLAGQSAFDALARARGDAS